MSVMRCNFCETLVDSDLHALYPVCDHSKSICEGCWTDALDHTEATLTPKLIEKYRDMAEPEFVSGEFDDFLCDLVSRIDGHEITLFGLCAECS